MTEEKHRNSVGVNKRKMAGNSNKFQYGSPAIVKKRESKIQRAIVLQERFQVAETKSQSTSLTLSLLLLLVLLIVILSKSNSKSLTLSLRVSLDLLLLSDQLQVEDSSFLTCNNLIMM